MMKFNDDEAIVENFSPFAYNKAFLIPHKAKPERNKMPFFRLKAVEIADQETAIILRGILDLKMKEEGRKISLIEEI